MERRAFVLTALLCACGAPALNAQPARRPVQLGFLRIATPPKEYLDALEQGLRDRGYVPGRDVVIEYRYADNHEDQLDRLASELIEHRVAIIIVAGNQAARAAKNATRTVPIVMAVANDPVASGIVASLARPGGNITGTTLLSSTLAGKRLELVKQVMPRVSRVAVLLNEDAPAHAIAWKETLAAAATLRIVVQPFAVRDADMFDDAFAAMAKSRMEALVLFEDAMFASERVRLAALAEKTRLPTVFGQRNSVDVGGLMSYGPSITDAYRNAASFVDRILRGAKPGDLPVEQPTKFELVINLNTAKALGLAIPQSVLLRADEVIQ
jgi:putative ABC transport system substrate-binding protein